MVDINELPHEILLRVFTFFLRTETQYAFLQNVAKVCQLWKKISKDSSLWLTFDGTLSFPTLKKYCKSGLLKNVEVLVFSKTKHPTSRKELESIYKNLPRLRSINFSNVIEMFLKRECHLFSELCNYCPDLQEIIIHDTETIYRPKVSYKLFDDFLRLQGSKLVSLDFSNLCLPNFKNLFLVISASCPNLERLLALSSLTLMTNNIFPIETMQNSLRKLKVLCLGYPIVLQCGNSQKSIGFPNLRTFTCRSEEDRSFEDHNCRKLLEKSSGLRVLDIRGCLNITTSALCSLPILSIEKLYVSQTRLCSTKGFIDVLRKWGHSLLDLDVSRMKGDLINDNFVSLISNSCLQNLESLDVSNTAITVPTLRLIIENCHKLKFLNVESCRYLDRGCKHAYAHEKAIKELYSIMVNNMEVK